MKKKTEITKLVDEIIRATKEVYKAGYNPFTIIDWKKGRKTLTKVIQEYTNLTKNL